MERRGAARCSITATKSARSPKGRISLPALGNVRCYRRATAYTFAFESRAACVGSRPISAHADGRSGRADPPPLANSLFGLMPGRGLEVGTNILTSLRMLHTNQ